jgi:hypothetical protein
MLSTTLLLAASMVVGQAGAPSNYEHLKSIEWVIGEIEWEGEADEGIPGVCEKGDKLLGWAEHEWILGKNAIAVKISIKTADRRIEVLSHQGIIGWDAGEGKIVSCGFNSLGWHGMSTWIHEGDKWLLKGKGVKADGKRTASTLIVSEISDESFTIQGVDRTEGDEKLQDDTPVVCTFIRDDEDEDEDDDEDDDD